MTHSLLLGIASSSSGSKNVSLGYAFTTVYGSGGSGEPTTFEVVHNSRFWRLNGFTSSAGLASTVGTTLVGGAKTYATATHAATAASDHNMPRMGRVLFGVREVGTL